MAQEVVDTGPMWGGKSLKLLDRIAEAEFRELGVTAVRPQTDRHPEPMIVARRVIKGVIHEGPKCPAQIVSTRREFRRIWSNPSISLLAIDEVQFFPRWIISEIALALSQRRREDFTVAVAGLNLDYARRPFGPMPYLLAMASEVRVWPGVCMKCKGRYGPGLYTQRLKGTTQQVQPGDMGDYEVRCGVCHYIFEG